MFVQGLRNIFCNGARGRESRRTTPLQRAGKNNQKKDKIRLLFNLNISSLEKTLYGCASVEFYDKIPKWRELLRSNRPGSALPVIPNQRECILSYLTFVTETGLNLGKEMSL